MKFRLEIELGNEAMQSLDDVWTELYAKSKREWPQEPAAGGESGNIRDRNGNNVGKWEVVEEQKHASVRRAPEMVSSRLDLVIASGVHIEFKHLKDGSCVLSINGQIKGQIEETPDGWRYIPTGEQPSETFPSLESCKRYVAKLTK